MKKISIKENELNEILEKIKQDLYGGKGIPTEIKYTVNPEIILGTNDKLKIVFSSMAYKKMWTLVEKVDSEVGWYGTVERISNKEFLIKDILLCPQEVTGATVTTDDDEYRDWSDSLDDETFNTMRFYGHSHVNMGTTPSGTDTSHYNNMLQNTKDFFIFGIFNKRKDFWFNVYDVENNFLYGKNDILMEYYLDEIDDWVTKEVKEKVKEKKYIPPANTYGNRYGYGDYGNYGYGQKTQNNQKENSKKEDVFKNWREQWDAEEVDYA